jgi:hypothetical protein
MTSFPDLSRVIAAFNAERARHVVIGGFAVIAHQYLRTTEDVDLLIPDDRENDLRVLAALRRLKAHRRGGEPIDEAHVVGRSHVRVEGDGGIIDLLRGGEPPLGARRRTDPHLRTREPRGLQAPVGQAA